MSLKIIPYNSNLRAKARELRNNSTLGEILLWQKIKNKSLGVEFNRQVPIDNYIVDFFCRKLFLAIEIDGDSHDFADIAFNDEIRQSRLESLGVIFLRIDDREVKCDMDNVIREIEAKLESLVDNIPLSKEENYL